MEPWIDTAGNRYSNEQIFAKILATTTDGEHEYQVVVGTDSNANGRSYKFVTVLALWKVGFGADYYYMASYEPRSTFRGNHKMRLYQEVAKSIEAATLIRDTIGFTISELHIDAAPKELNEFSSTFSDQLKGYATSSGFVAVIKPNAWCASYAADHHSK